LIREATAMTRIATPAENSLTLFYLQQNRTQLDTLNEQIATGQQSQTYAGIAPQASHLVDFRAQSSRQQDFIDTINTVSTRMQTMDLPLGTIQSEVQSFRSLLPNGAFGTAQPDIASQAKLLLQQVAGYLNTQDGTRYVFGGSAATTPPVDLSQLPTGAAANLTTPVNGTPATGGYYAGGDAVPPVRIDQQVTVNYGITANDASTFEPIIRVLNYLANNAPLNQNSATDQANATSAGQMIDQAMTSLTNMRGKLGLQEKQLNDSLTVHQTTQNIAQNGISNIESVDQATVITQLQTLETQMEASFSATSEISKLSLVNYLSA
jgi:flagellar hook-associated protein 3 FlgL